MKKKKKKNCDVSNRPYIYLEICFAEYFKTEHYVDYESRTFKISY